MANDEPQGTHRTTWTRRVAVIAAAALVVACVGVVIDRWGEQPSYGPERAQTLPEAIACSRTIAIGDVVEVTGGRSPQATATMRVSEWIRPDHGSPTLAFSAHNPAADGDPAWKVGGPVLVMVPTESSSAVAFFRGEQLTTHRKLVKSALPDASRTSCPSP